MTFTILVALWVVVAVIVGVLALWRFLAGMREDDSLHVHEGDEGLVAKQVATVRKIERIEHWGEALTVVVLVYGVALAGAYVYMSWVERNATAIAGR